MHARLYKEDFWNFVEKSMDAREKIQEQLKLLEDRMQHFYSQARQSLEWNFSPQIKDLDKKDFFRKIRDLGGKIDESAGKGSHFSVIFKIFENKIGPSKKNKNKFAGGTIKSFLNQRADEIKKYLDPKYLQCYFFTTKKIYEEIFLAKYKSVFKV